MDATERFLKDMQAQMKKIERKVDDLEKEVKAVRRVIR